MLGFNKIYDAISLLKCHRTPATKQPQIISDPLPYFTPCLGALKKARRGKTKRSNHGLL